MDGTLEGLAVRRRCGAGQLPVVGRHHLPRSSDRPGPRPRDRHLLARGCQRDAVWALRWNNPEAAHAGAPQGLTSVRRPPRRCRTSWARGSSSRRPSSTSKVPTRASSPSAGRGGSRHARSARRPSFLGRPRLDHHRCTPCSFLAGRASAADGRHRAVGLEERRVVDAVAGLLASHRRDPSLRPAPSSSAPERSAVRRSVSSRANRQLRTWPSAVSRTRSQAPQNGRVTEAMMPTRAGPPSTSQVSAGALPRGSGVGREHVTCCGAGPGSPRR